MSTTERSPQQRIEVGVLGATGMVGQQFIRLLASHPWFKPAWLAASDRSEGRRMRTPLPGGLRRRFRSDAGPCGCRRARRARAPRWCSLRSTPLSRRTSSRPSLPPVTSSSATRNGFRMDPAVPLVIPEVNADHLAIIPRQRRERGWSGAIVTNPNCSTDRHRDDARAAAHIRPPLGDASRRSRRSPAPAIPACRPSTSSATSSRSSRGEEEKIESETQKILGAFADDAFTAHPVVVERDHDARAGDRRAHGVDVGRARRAAVARRSARGAPGIQGQAAGARAAVRAAVADRRHRRA